MDAAFLIIKEARDVFLIVSLVFFVMCLLLIIGACATINYNKEILP